MGESDEAEIIPKTQFADIVWDDAPLSGDLINHFRGTMTLSRLELITIALRCFHSRLLKRRAINGDSIDEPGNEGEGHKLRGDKAYALAGLLRIRPSADATDSEFQAFARLSLTNDSDQILERFICMQPKSPIQSWQTLEDAWSASLSVN